MMKTTRNIAKKWKSEILSGRYKDKAGKKIYPLFRYQRAELTGSDYYALDLVEGKDFTFEDIDPKKVKINEMGENGIYDKAIFGDGLSSNFTNNKMEKWNAFAAPSDGDALRDGEFEDEEKRKHKKSLLEILSALH